MNEVDKVVQERRWRVALRTPLILVWTLILLIPSLTTRFILGRASRTVIALWYRGCCRLLGLEIDTFGKPATTRTVLFAANHISYLDILIIGGLLKAHFIAKSEVRSWPGIGFLAVLAGTIFVERRARLSRQQRDVIRSSLANGESLVLFPEGTSSNGSRVLPFKSSLFSVFEAEDRALDVVIQPITIDYVSFRNGPRIEDHQRDLYAWHGDMTLAPHLRQVLGLPGAKVRIYWHDLISPKGEINRKDLAKQVEEAVVKGLAKSRNLDVASERCSTVASADAAA